MPLGDHLDELRQRILWSLVLPIPIAILLMIFRNPLLKILTDPLLIILKEQGLSEELQVLAPQEYFLTVLKISCIGSIVLSTPWVLFQIWKFVSPGLWKHEQKVIFLLVPISSFLTLAGLLLFYYVMLPIVLNFFISFANDFKPSSSINNNTVYKSIEISSSNNSYPKIPITTDTPTNPEPGSIWLLMPEGKLQLAISSENQNEIITIENKKDSYLNQSFQLGSYLDFITLLALGICIAFQLPLVILILGWLGFFTPGTLKSYRKYAFMGCGILGMLLTPADLFSMFILMIPLYLLYELGIIILQFIPFETITTPIRDKKSTSRNKK